jgi:hypothetical protein
MTKTLNQIFFFPPPKSEYFFQQHWEFEYLKKNKNIPPPWKLNGPSLRIMLFSPTIMSGPSTLSAVAVWKAVAARVMRSLVAGT